MNGEVMRFDEVAQVWARRLAQVEMAIHLPSSLAARHGQVHELSEASQSVLRGNFFLIEPEWSNS
jgi:hypothetical protein